MSEDYTTRARRETDACPNNLTGDPGSRAYRADIDARELVHDVRELDVRQVWGRLTSWCDTNPARLLAVVVSLAALVDPDTATGDWTRSIGGTAALHPDFRPAENSRPAAAPYQYDEEIIRLRESGLPLPEIARRTGASWGVVQKVCAHGQPRRKAAA